MELKPYQRQVTDDLALFLEYIQKEKRTNIAYNKYWEDKIGPYNPISQEGMRPYQNNVPKAVHICIKVPTAGGKTFIACNALHTIFDSFDPGKPKAVVWLVPWSNLLDQTVRNLSDPTHPYRQKLNSLFNHRVEVYEKKDLLQGSNFNPTVVKEQLSIFVMSFASIRASKKEDRKIYEENGQLAQFAQSNTNQAHVLENTDETALINVIRSLNPVVVVDESHNAESDLSVDMLRNLNPCLILDLTATPKNNSNIISFVSAIELKREHMVKLPVIVYNHHDKTEVINSALHLQRKLELIAGQEEAKGGRYIRPIVLFQAQPQTNDDNTTFKRLKEQLLKLGIPEEQIKIKTAALDELKGVNLMSRDCPVRYIITINALKEGWDCPFAYILASLADKSSAVDVEQILGRVLRQPYVMKHSMPLLNLSYVLTASTKFYDTLQSIVKGLQSAGFSANDYRAKDMMTIPEPPKPQEALEGFLFPEQQKTKPEPAPADEIDTERIQYNPYPEQPAAENNTVNEITDTALAQNEDFEKQVNSVPPSDAIFTELGDKVKKYKMREAFAAKAKEIRLPQFYLSVPQNQIFNLDDGLVLLSQVSLLDGFQLANEDTKISFESIDSELYKIDLEQTKGSEYTPSFMKIEDSSIKEPIVDYILAKPRENQIKDITHRLLMLIGNIYPIPDQDIKKYVSRILENFNAEQIRDFLIREFSYKDKIKKKIKTLAEAYAEKKFRQFLDVGRIQVQYNFSLPTEIIPGTTAPAITKSLYEQEGKMNNFEARVISEIANLSNVAFWHRNQERGKGFAINGFKSNHYPDFIIVTNSGKIILLETKGDDRDNSDSEAKNRLGRAWAIRAGDNYSYFMVFETNKIADTYTVEEVKELVGMM